MPHFFNTPHAFKKIGEMQSGEMQFGEMPHTRILCVSQCGVRVRVNPSGLFYKLRKVYVFL